MSESIPDILLAAIRRLREHFADIEARCADQQTIQYAATVKAECDLIIQLGQSALDAESIRSQAVEMQGLEYGNVVPFQRGH